MHFFIPPVLVFTLIAVLYGLKKYAILALAPMRSNGSMPWEIVLIIALIILGIAGLHFVKLRTQLHTFSKPTKLVQTGLFKYTRNPMYVGLTLITLSAALYFNSYIALLAPIIFFLAANYWYIPFEERNMTKTFGKDYEAYKKQVRRWI